LGNLKKKKSNEKRNIEGETQTNKQAKQSKNKEE
jgi:hypothetical protein